MTYLVKDWIEIPNSILFSAMYIFSNVLGLFLFVFGIKKLRKYGLSPRITKYLQQYEGKLKKAKNFFLGIKTKYYIALAVFFSSLAVYLFLGGNAFNIPIFLIGMLSILFLINIPSEWLEDSFAAISYRLKISAVFAGGLFLAVASSSTEFFTSLSGVVIHKIFSIGFDTLIWSSLFNLCLIIGICTFYKPKIFISRRLTSRDLTFYGITIILLLVLGIDGNYTNLDFVLLIILYVIYVVFLYFDKSQPYKTDTKDSKKVVNLKLIFGLLFIAFFAHFLVSFGQESIKLADQFYNITIPIGVLACTLYGPGTSIADLFVSISATKKGEDSAAIVNTISSNTFDLTICLAVPGLIYTNLTGNTIQIDLNSSFLLISMLILSFILVLIVLWDSKITKREGSLLIMYYIFCTVVYVYSLF